jgi:signal transduction histidine kinase
MLRRLLDLSWIHTAYDVAIAVVVAYMTTYYSEGYDQAIGWSMALTLVFRRRRPMTVMGLICGLALVQYLLATYADPALAGSPTGYDVAVLIAMVTVVTHAEPMWHAYTAGGAVLVGVIVGFGGFTTHDGTAEAEDFLEVATFGGISSAVWLTATVLRTRRLYVASLEARAATAEREREHLVRLAAAEERAEIARELHDVVAHTLAVMILQADGAGYALKTDVDKAAAALQIIAATGRDALDDMHRIVKVLRADRSSDGQERPDEAVGRRKVSLDDLETVAERARAAGLKVTLTVEGARSRLPTADELTVFRLVQESLTNVLRHAGPGAQVTITLRFDGDAVLVRVIDDGAGKLAGHEPASGGSGGGNGLVGMRERVEVSGGRFTAGPRLGAGWQVDAEIPVRVTG